VDSDALREAFRDGGWARLLHAADAALVNWPAAIIGARNERLSRMGQPLGLPLTPVGRRLCVTSGVACRAYSLGGEFVGVLRYEGRGGLWRPEKVFAVVETTEGS
jgi:hypothetical protein